jgi:hypothetical protein
MTTKYLFLAGLDVLPPVCMGCGSPIHDQFILRVSPDLSWHAACLKVCFFSSDLSWHSHVSSDLSWHVMVSHVSSDLSWHVMVSHVSSDLSWHVMVSHVSSDLSWHGACLKVSYVS